ncbi:asparagine synthetase B [Candidatus Saccharibacteria bacterium]|nr:asparagine synthetase B [Calditrichia bacterium]NIV99772.1 asparagine synthetase B [Candidatus Saccharibacteria bacterium]NIW79612.1 asparagine synthetase B [Calditrichia bacterium]
MIYKIILGWFLLIAPLSAQHCLIPMDFLQNDHLKSYGVAYWALTKGVNVEWLLNYRGGSFLMPVFPGLESECRIRGVAYEVIGSGDVNSIYATIESENMERILLEKAPKIAIYTPPNTQPWDDAVTMALEYAEVPYDKVYDDEVLAGKLPEYDWLHLHHEDFTGQYGKFYSAFRNAPWYIEDVKLNEAIAKKHGFPSVSELKKEIARNIKQYVDEGGFLFAMCSATDALDIALAAEGIDIVDVPFDGDPPEANFQQKLDYSKTLAFEDFKLYPDPNLYEFSDIDIPPSFAPRIRDPETDYFSLFEFSAKYDPVPTMLTQNHVDAVKGFMGQTTMFNRTKIKPSVVIMGEVQGTDEVRYIHGNSGKGTFTFYGGHDPEDYTHAVGDPPTQLELHKNSPGYRLILNNILFPAAKKKKLKT